MARNYTIKSFFRQAPNELLERYFTAKGIFSHIDFKKLKKTETDPLIAAWNDLSDSDRRNIDVDMRSIFNQSCEQGFKAIIDEAIFHLKEPAISEFVEELSGLRSHYRRAMITFLDYPHFWSGASLFYHADTLSHWRKRKNMGHKSAAVDSSSIDQLAGLIRTYFHKIEGRGNNCVVEPLRRGELDYFFAYPEDYSAEDTEWVNGVFKHRPHNPAFEIVFVYSKDEGTLDLNFRGTFKLTEPLQKMFSEAILKMDELPPDPKDDRVYDLSPLMKRDFDFVYDVGSGIERIVMKKVRFSSMDGRGDKITLEAKTEHDEDAVYKLMKRVGKSVPLTQYHITQVELAVMITMDADKAARPATIRITHPNSCSLKYDERDLRLRKMLEASGIEPKDQDIDEGDE
jgi:hypothetical protein